MSEDFKDRLAVDWNVVEGEGGKGSKFVEDPNSLKSVGIARILDLISEGEIRGLVNGAKSIFLDDTPVQNSDNSLNFQGVTWAAVYGLPDQGYIPGLTKIEAPFAGFSNVSLLYNVSNVRRITDPNADAAIITINVPALNQATDKSLKGTTVSVKIRVKEQADQIGAVWKDATLVTITGKTTSPYEEDHRVELSGIGPWDIEVVRQTADSADVKLVNATSWSRLQLIYDHKFSYPYSAMIGLEVNSQYFGTSIPRRAYEVYGLIVKVPENYDPITRLYTGTWNGVFKWAWTNNPAWVFYDLVTNNRYGLGIASSYVDKWSLYSIAQYCDGVNARETSARSNKLKYSSDLSNALWSVGNAAKLSVVGTDENGSAIWKIAPNATSTTDHFVQQTTSNADWVSGTNGAFSFIVKSAGHGFAKVQTFNLANTVYVASINLATGAISGVTAGATATAVRSGSDRWKVTVVIPMGSGATNPTLRVWVMSTLAGTAFAGNNVDGIEVSSFQAEPGSTSTAYIGTGASVVTVGSTDDFNVVTGRHGVSDGYGGIEPRFTFNGILNQGEQAYKVLQSLASTFRGMVYWSAGLVTASQDRPADPVKLFNPANVIGGDFEYMGSSKKARHTVAVVGWNNPATGYEMDYEVVEDRSGIVRYGMKPSDMTAFGCTSRGQAKRMGRWTLATEALETDSVKFKTGFDGVDLVPGDLILIADPAYAGVRMGGRVMAIPTSSQLQIDAAFTFVSGDVYQINVMSEDGRVIECQVANAPGTTNVVQLVAPISTPDLPMVGAIYIISEVGNVEPRPFRVISVAEAEEHQFEIFAIEHQVAKYDIADDAADFDTEVKNTYQDLPNPSYTSPPDALFLQLNTADKGYGTVPTLFVDWKPSTDPLLQGYLVTYRLDDDNWVPMPMTAASSIEIPNPSKGTYDVRVMAINRFGVPSAVITKSINVGSFSVATSKNLLSNLRGDRVDGTFTGTDVQFYWDAKPLSAPTAAASASFRDEFFDGFKVEIYAGATLKRTEYVYEAYYLYDIAKNVADGTGRAVTAKVSMRSKDGTFSNVSTLTLTNPAPTAPTVTISTQPGMVYLTFVEPLDPDYAGIAVYASTTSGFTPNDATNKVWEGIGQPILKLAAGTTQYLRWVFYDAFGKAGLTVAAQVSQAVPYIVSGDLSPALAIDVSTAVSAASAASASASAAATSATNAATNSSAAATSASNAATQAANAVISATTASTQASNALTSATNSASSAGAAATSATNAGTSATTATTQAGNASTSATNAATQATNALSSANAAALSASGASTSATNAANSATAATTSATNAANSATSAATSATNAGNSATAASGSATTATNQANAAAGSASAAAGSATAASSSYTKTVIADGNMLFDEGRTGWATSTANATSGVEALAGAWTFQPSYNGKTNVLTTTVNTQTSLYSIRKYTINPSRKYRVNCRFHIGAGTGANVRMYFGLQQFDATGATVGSNQGFRYISVGGLTYAPGTGWVEVTGSLLTGTGTGATQFETTCAFIRLIAFANYDANSTVVTAVDEISFHDVTEAENAAASATAAATSASSAATSATNAGSSASAANTSATNAATSATNAANSASAASTSATSASGSASTATTQAANAATSASAAATSATNASNSATAASTSASSAATQATNAGNSATSASTSATNAASSYAGARDAAAVTAPSDFVQDGIHWTTSTSGLTSLPNMPTTGVTYPTVSGIGKVLQFNGAVAGTQINVGTRTRVQLVAGRSHKLTIKRRATVDDTGFFGGAVHQDWFGFAALDVNGASLGNMYLATTSAENVAAGWRERTATKTTAEILTAFPTAVFISWFTILNLVEWYNPGYNGATGNSTIQVAFIRYEDVTVQVAAAASATAAATSASNAATSATAAGSSATSASNSATSAATSATNAANSASAASTSATSASGSASTATTQAANAATSASAAATSATNASNSATAASTSASTASTQATNAGNSATSASTSATNAASSYTNTVLVDGNQNFSDGLTGWTVQNGAGSTVQSSLGSRTNVLTNTTGGLRADVFTVKKFPFDPARKYKIRGWYYTGAGTGPSQVYIGFRAYDSAGAALTHNPGSYAYIAAQGVMQAANAGWVEYVSPVIAPQVAGITYGYPPGTASINLLALGNYNASTTVWGLDNVSLIDVTEAEAAATSATAAATSASNAATSATNAGTSATSAATSATNASTQATNAANSASSASTSATNASNSASTASTQAANASTSAGAAATSATNASNSATAASGSASTAATQATNAGNSATAAAASAVNAASSFTAANLLTASQFPDRYDGTTGSYFVQGVAGSPASGTDNPSNATAAGYGPVRQDTNATGSSSWMASRGVLPAIAGRIYRVEGELQRTALSGTANAATQFVVEMRGLDAAYASIGSSAATGVTPSGSVQTLVGLFSNTASAGVTAWTTSSVFLRPYVRAYTGGATSLTVQFRRLTVTDVTEQMAAATSATAASTSASAAATSATNAGTSASAANTSATNAATSASNASTSATNASNSATTAAGSASTATTQAGNAATSATNAANSATAANTSATNAATSATNAGNSATSATTSANNAASSYTAANAVAINSVPSDFSSNGQYWFNGFTGSPTTRTPISAGGIWSFPTVAGTGTVIQAAVTGSTDVGMMGAIKAISGRRYRITSYVRVLTALTGTPSWGVTARGLDTSYNHVPAASVSNGYNLPAANNWYGIVLDIDGTTFTNNGGVFLRPSVNFGTAGNTYQCQFVLLEDITDSFAANNSATAAATSASNASTSATNAGNSATSASTSATNAASSFTSASTQATNAANSATAAGTSATNAGTSATNAATQATNAANSATAASGSATTATTQATNAGNSATAAATSATNATSAFTNATTASLVLFPDRIDATASLFTLTATGASNSGASASAGVTTEASYGNVYGLTAATYLYSKGAAPASTGRVYEVEAEFSVTTYGGAAVTPVLALVGMNSAFASLGTVSANGATISSATSVVVTRRFSNTAPVGGSAWTASSVWVRPAARYTGGAGSTVRLRRLTMRDVTALASSETQATNAASSASAASTSASAAATSATNAGTSATNAAASASTASTQAGNASSSATTASTQATNASTSASGAASSATSASGSASTATTQAGNASTSATNAASSAATAGTSAASAATSASTAASVGVRALIKNPNFTDFPSTPGIPTGWTNPVNGTGNRVTGETGLYAYQLSGGAAADAYVSQDGIAGGIVQNAWFVIEAQVKLDSGALTGAGVLFRAVTSGGATAQDLTLTFSTDKDSTNTVVGAGTVGKVYRFAKLVRVTAATADRVRVHAMSHWSSLGSTAAANQITWYSALVRPATDQEIASQQATTDLAAQSVTVATQSTAIATLQQVYGTYGIQVNANGNVAGLYVYSGSGITTTSGVRIEANQFTIRSGTASAVTPFTYDAVAGKLSLNGVSANEIEATATIKIGAGDNTVILDGKSASDKRIAVGNSVPDSAPFWVSKTGKMKATDWELYDANGALMLSKNGPTDAFKLSILAASANSLPTTSAVSGSVANIPNTTTVLAANKVSARLGDNSTVSIGVSWNLTTAYGANNAAFPSTVTLDVQQRYSADGTSWGAWSSMGSQTFTKITTGSPTSTQYRVKETTTTYSEYEQGISYITYVETSSVVDAGNPASFSITATSKNAGYYEYAVVGGTNSQFAGCPTTLTITDTDGVPSFIINNTASTGSVAYSNPIGIFKRLKVATTSTTGGTVTADFVIVSTPEGLTRTIANLNTTFSTSTTGLGKLDTGTVAANTWYYLWAVSNGSVDGVVLSTSNTSPSLTGYRYKALIGAMRANAGTALVPFRQVNQRVRYVFSTNTPFTIASSTSGNVSTPTWTAFNITGFFPTLVSGEVQVSLQLTNNSAMAAPNNTFGALTSATAMPPIMSQSSGNYEHTIFLESNSIYYASNSANAKLVARGFVLDI